MTRVRLTCNHCGDVEILGDEFWRLTVYVGLADGDAFEFVCPDCDATVLRQASPRTVEVLVGVGVQLVNAAPITEAEVDEFVRQLRGWRGDL